MVMSRTYMVRNTGAAYIHWSKKIKHEPLQQPFISPSVSLLTVWGKNNRYKHMIYLQGFRAAISSLIVIALSFI